MAFQFLIVLCASTYCFEHSVGQCFGREPMTGTGFPSSFTGRPFDRFDGTGVGPAWPPTSCGLGPLAPQSGLAASYGGGLSITSSSPISPTGLTVKSENAIEGTVTIAGQLPFLGAVATEGTFATAGFGAVSYGCGDGTVNIVAETPITPIAPSYGSGISPYSYGPAMSGYKGLPPIGGCGCGVLY